MRQITNKIKRNSLLLHAAKADGFGREDVVDRIEVALLVRLNHSLYCAHVVGVLLVFGAVLVAVLDALQEHRAAEDAVVLRRLNQFIDVKV